MLVSLPILAFKSFNVRITLKQSFESMYNIVDFPEADNVKSCFPLEVEYYVLYIAHKNEGKSRANRKI